MRYLLVLLFLLSSTYIIAQNKIVTCYVSDENNQPIEYFNVKIVVGENETQTTFVDGKFEVDLRNENKAQILIKSISVR